MPSTARYRELLENIQQAHAAHKKVYAEARSKYGTTRKAQEQTQQALEAFNDALKALYGQTLLTVRKRVLAGESSVIDEVLNFIEADVAAFGSGYNKEWYYRKLKRMRISTEQADRLKQIALNRCSNPEHRREDSELRRLMTRIADQDFVDRVRRLPDNGNPYVARKKRLMLEVVLQGRKDLRKAQSLHAS
jgi:hypothetical protein